MKVNWTEAPLKNGFRWWSDDLLTRFYVDIDEQYGGYTYVGFILTYTPPNDVTRPSTYILRKPVYLVSSVRGHSDNPEDARARLEDWLERSQMPI